MLDAASSTYPRYNDACMPFRVNCFPPNFAPHSLFMLTVDMPSLTIGHLGFHRTTATSMLSAPCASLILRPNLTSSYLGKSRNLPRETPQSTFRHVRSCCRPLLNEILLSVLACSSSNLTGSLSRRQLNVRVTPRWGRRTRPVPDTVNPCGMWRTVGLLHRCESYIIMIASR